MTGPRFSAFSFVDRITHCSARRIEGHYTVPAGVTRFPASLMAEAVGQLAAWSAMAQLDFAWRPVAGLAEQTRYHRLVQPGQTMRLEADISRCDAEAVAYGGRAHFDGQCAVELVNIVGPMLPMDEFDAPEAVRTDFEMLRADGAAPGRFAGVPTPQIEPLDHTPGQRLRATLRVPRIEDAPYFGDHFPRRPVFPGTLLLDALAGLAVQLAGEAMPAQATLAPTRIDNVKIRSFTAPGTVLELEAERSSVKGDSARLKLAARNEGKAVATARIDIGPLRSD